MYRISEENEVVLSHQNLFIEEIDVLEGEAQDQEEIQQESLQIETEQEEQVEAENVEVNATNNT